MKRTLSWMILFAWLSSTAQHPSISDILSTKKYKVNLMVDTLTGKVYDIPTMDGIVISGGAIAITREVPRHDTGYWLFFFIKPFVQGITPLYKRVSGRPFPPVMMTDINGGKLIPESFKGKIVFINFWSTKCGPCIAEIPELNRLVDSLRNGPFVFIAPAPEGRAAIAACLRQHPFKFDIVPDASGLLTALGVTGYPSQVIVDKDGTTVAVLEGAYVDPVTSRPLIRRQIDSVLKALML